MLDKICAQDFTPHLGRPWRLSYPDGGAFDLVLDSVDEKAKLKRPQDCRAPFSTLFKGPLEPSFLDGLFDLEIDGELFLHDVYISRIVPPWGLDTDSAYYQAIFN